MLQCLMKHIRSTYIIQTPASPVRIDFMPTQHWGNATSMASKTAAATSSRKEADLLQHIASKESGTLAVVKRISCAITESVSLLPPAGNGCESSRRHQPPPPLYSSLLYLYFLKENIY
ncbi:Uncharacterized protein APZ42_012296 [Daphnia magna]|uniref:Uncharacterized protein n=1 Tax=Daphnia magna TaxID=35525 RepID=A0A162RZP4_9CRUS|nr:Uncharacterized protein APZ42_012296 [Daphnia magna]